MCWSCTTFTGHIWIKFHSCGRDWKQDPKDFRKRQSGFRYQNLETIVREMSTETVSVENDPMLYTRVEIYKLYFNMSVNICV